VGANALVQENNTKHKVAVLKAQEIQGKEMIFELGGRSYLTEDESRRLTEAAEEADARWRKGEVIKRESERR